MSLADTSDISSLIESRVQPFAGSAADYDELLELIGDARFALLGEATHGTHEFYRRRSEITRRLILEKGFHAIAVEADWPDAYRVHRYVMGLGDDRSPEASLGDFKRFPLWMWRNLEVVDLIRWLREHNDGRHQHKKVGFYGLDLYSLFTSIHAVIAYLQKVDPAGAGRAKASYACFDHFAHDPQEYGLAASLGIAPQCEEQAIEQLIDLRAHAVNYLSRDGYVAEEELFFAQQNARLIEHAEEYYREMFRGRISTWNLRDRHMADTLTALAGHLSRTGNPAKIIVWEHNSHIGDARATQMGQEGELNVGQLTREHFGDQTRFIGFTTYSGTVSATSNWDEPVQRKQVKPALKGSIEALLHECALPAFALSFRDDHLAQELNRPLLERAIGVIYRPETERASHYFLSRVTGQFDAIIHIDQTHALEPLDITPGWQRDALPETYPSGL